jgi:hypothetical protein
LIERYLTRARELSEARRAQLVWQITEPLLPLLNEDRDSFAQSADRTARCERVLLQIVDFAQEKSAPIGVAPKPARPSSLF